ncbi:MAG: glycosyltransferase family 4 protein [bacterium]|nr:glycosyltransferase family 4 protein [bacterium]
MKKIVLATGIFYPDVGGPAIHVRKIAEALTENGWQVVVVAYGDGDGGVKFPFRVIRISRKMPLPVRMLKYYFAVFRHSFGAKIIYYFNLTSAGIPAFLTAKILGKKLISRFGGDPIWERVVENNKRFLSIIEYYEGKYYLKDNPSLFKWIKFVLNRTDIIVMYSDFWQNFYNKYYGIKTDNMRLIYNPVFKKEQTDGSEENTFTFLFAGRFVSYKNLELVLKVFDKISKDKDMARLVLIGKGPDEEKLKNLAGGLDSRDKIVFKGSMPQEELFEHIKNSSVCVGPALTEFNPNFILECLSFGKPAILSRENGLTIKLPEHWLFEAKSEAELEKTMRNFLDKDFYNNAKRELDAIMIEQTWEKVVASHLRILSSL